VEMPSELTEREVLEAIMRTKPDKAPGPDGIPNRVLQEFAGEASALLTRLFQAYLDHSVHPDHFKQATTVILRKPEKADYTDPSAYRPIALLNTLGKTLEAVVSQRMRYLYEKHALLPQTQMRARSQRSVDTALGLLLDQIHAV
jgi:hypothetical protein